jgi:hypothetical protein
MVHWWMLVHSCQAAYIVNLHSQGVRMADEWVMLGFNLEFLFKNILNFFMKSKALIVFQFKYLNQILSEKILMDPHMGSSEILLSCSLRLWPPSIWAQTYESPLLVDMGALIYITICNIAGRGWFRVHCMPTNDMHIKLNQLL